MSEVFSWVGYTPVACSSTGHGTTIETLANADEATDRSWESGRFAKFPQEIILRLDARSEVSHILISAKPERNLPTLQIQLGDGLYGSFVDANYHEAGRAEAITDLFKQIPCYGIGSFVKLIIAKAPVPSAQNPQGQVGLGVLKVWGRKMKYEDGINEINPVKTHTDQVDQVLLELGVPLDTLMWSKEDHDSYRYAPIDEDTRETLMELDNMRNQAFEREDYTALEHLVRDIRKVYGIGAELLGLKRELGIAISKEDFELAKELKDRIARLEKARDAIDALYETKRYERMILMGKPTDSHMAFVNRMMEEERLRLELLRRQREEEMRRHKAYLDELERKRREEEMRRRRDQVAPPRAKPKKEEEERPEPDDPYEFNEGDHDLDPYLRPKLLQAGGTVAIADMEVLKRAERRGVLRVLGVRELSAAMSENWRHREAAAQAMLEFLEAPLLPKYQQDTRALLKGACDLANIACEDKILSIYLIGLKVLLTALSPPISETKVTGKTINSSVKEFIPVMLTKICELNYRARDLSMHTLIELFRHPQVKIGGLVDAIMKITEPGQDPPQKQPWRIVLARLEILLHIIQEFGVDAQEWNWKEVFHNLIVPCFSHANGDIRMACVEIAVALYQKLGMETRLEVEALGRKIKPQLSQMIYEKMLEVDQNQGGQKMGTIVETQEWAEHTPPGTAKGKGPSNWSKLKQMITNLAEEEAKGRKK